LLKNLHDLGRISLLRVLLAVWSISGMSFIKLIPWDGYIENMDSGLTTLRQNFMAWSLRSVMLVACVRPEDWTSIPLCFNLECSGVLSNQSHLLLLLLSCCRNPGLFARKRIDTVA
jgi:hypothetical protein